MNESIYGGQCSNQNECGNGRLCYSAFKNNQLHYECQPLSTCENADMGRYCENGICVVSQDNTGFSCICDIGHYGAFCQKRFDSCRFPNLCSKNGFCENNNEKSFTCNCSTGYYGDFCLDKIVVTVGNITVKVTVPVEVMSPINRTAAIIGGSVVAGIIFIAIIVAILICIIVAVKRRQLLKKRNVVGMEIGTSTDNHGSVSKWSVKNKGKNNLTMRLSKLWNNKTLRGMPTVPSRMSGNMTSIDPQIVSQEETVLENEVIHDNRPVMESWNKYLENLVEKRVINKGLMANLQTREHMPTTDWMMDWGEVYTLDAQYNSDNSKITVQGCEFKLETMSDGLTCGWCIPADFDAKQKFMAVSKTKRYLIVGMVTIGPDVDGNECREEIKFIANHIKSEGF
ncbi:hypothetical protein HELRODRAFT_190574 [Helobdella robusta]|uniref:EGF-like domain-containing protein n=1 Tax=Helobdella robusta TaxID=6412 RepID=T1FS39_HELRO|nr:hypothetical protein HELRODRAFT_190574 [Helobdella robusta]ESO09607.1 hypothetical protein HELRODRAFT_190574 [Helobdella robusta]